MMNIMNSNHLFIITVAFATIALSFGVDVPTGSFSLRRKLQTLPALSHIEVINAATDTVIGNLTNGLIIELSKYQLTDPKNINFNAVAVPSTNVARVVFSLDTNNNFRNEGSAPFAACGNTGQNFFQCTGFVTDRTYILGATPYTASGTSGTKLSFAFSIVLAAPTAVPSSKPSTNPSSEPTALPVALPVVPPSPIIDPSEVPTLIPSNVPSSDPVAVQSLVPTVDPSSSPSSVDSKDPPSTPIAAPVVPVIAPVSAPVVPPVSAPVHEPVYSLSNGKWIQTNVPGLTKRHEACFLMVERIQNGVVKRVAVLLAGRRRNIPNIYDPVTRTWSNGTLFGTQFPSIDTEMHHTQCVAVNGKVWVKNAWGTGYPYEKFAKYIYIYDPFNDIWEVKDYPADYPTARRRGGAAIVAVGELIYVAFGNIGGHEVTTDVVDSAVSLTMLDVYNTTDGSWRPLANATYPRDHVGGALMADGQLCFAGGRNGGLDRWPMVAPTECYNPQTDTWSVKADIPALTAGANYGRSCDGKLLISGGESNAGGSGTASKKFFQFDGNTWTVLPNMTTARHGSGLAVDCVCNALYVASGSAGAGGGPEQTNMETFFFNGVDTSCPAPNTNPVTTPVAVPVSPPVPVPVSAPVDAPVTVPVPAPVATPVAAPIADPPTTIRINCGNTVSSIVVNGNIWSQDMYFSGGSIRNDCSANTGLSQMDCDYRSGSSIVYSVPIPNGVYNVTFYMSENWWQISGRRVFNVSIENVWVMVNMDLFATSGGRYRSVTRSYVVTVADGFLSISGIALPTKDQAAFNGIEIMSLGFAPVSAPVTVPVSAPVAVPVAAPVAAPAPVPVVAPVTAPVVAPVTAPVVAPSVTPPVSSSGCTIPKLVSGWTGYKASPLSVSEAQGHLYPNNELMVVGGFPGNFQTSTNRSFALNLTNPFGNWRELDPVPIVEGLTHASHASIGNISYYCGGYRGPDPGPATDKCFIYNHTIQPRTTGQWSSFPSLPGPRSGGAMWYDEDTNSLIYGGGALRPIPGSHTTVDQPELWSISLTEPLGSWTLRGSVPFMGNHVTKTTVKYLGDKQRHYYLGGQAGANERNGNTPLVYELHANNYTWTQRQSMTFGRGHFGESTIPYNNCGFLIINGAVNGNVLTQTNDISYYDIGANNWTYIGNASSALNTPVCTVHGGYIYCQGGTPFAPRSSRAQYV